MLLVSEQDFVVGRIDMETSLNGGVDNWRSARPHYNTPRRHTFFSREQLTFSCGIG